MTWFEDIVAKEPAIGPIASGHPLFFITSRDFDGASYRFLILTTGTATSPSRFFI
jgi:hypothetical protein